MTDIKYMRADDFFRNARPTTISEDVRRQVAEENTILTTSQAYRAAGFDGEAWSFLGSKVVGAEGN